MSVVGGRVACGVVLLGLVVPVCARAQDRQAAPVWQYWGFFDAAFLNSFNNPSNHLFRNRGTTPRVDELDLNMAAAGLKKTASTESRVGIELTAQSGEDSKIFGFSSTAPPIGGADFLLHLGPTNVSYLAPAGKGLTLQGGIFNSLIGYDGLYAKDNLAYTRPWGADYTPYLMMGVNASYPFTDRVTVTVGVVNGYFHLAHANDAPSLVGQLAYADGHGLSAKETVLYGAHQPATDLTFWRVLSDTIVERKAGAVTVAGEFQFGSEKVDTPGDVRALWMSGQLPVHWAIRGPWSLTVRPEFAWDRDGRWIAGQLGAGQSVKAVTTSVEYRIRYKSATTIVRVEHRYDNARGPGGGFFDDGPPQGGPVPLTPRQHVLAGAVIVAFDSTQR